MIAADGGAHNPRYCAACSIAPPALSRRLLYRTAYGHKLQFISSSLMFGVLVMLVNAPLSQM
jgi:hypothetical protein